MKLFKSIDEKLEDAGFKLLPDQSEGLKYECTKDKGYCFTHIVTISRLSNGLTMLKSYDKASRCIVGMTRKELKLFLKKMKQVEKW